MNTTNTVVIHADDNVAVALEDIGRGEFVVLRDGERIVASDPIPCGHKVAIKDIPAGSAVVKYGEVIGTASVPIAKGSHVHSHNMGGGEVS